MLLYHGLISSLSHDLYQKAIALLSKMNYQSLLFYHFHLEAPLHEPHLYQIRQPDTFTKFNSQWHTNIAEADYCYFHILHLYMYNRTIHTYICITIWHNNLLSAFTESHAPHQLKVLLAIIK